MHGSLFHAFDFAEQSRHASLALESTLRVMRDPMAGEPTLNNYDSHEVEEGYDTRYLQPDWNNFGQDTEKPASDKASQQAHRSGEVFGTGNNFNLAPNSQRLTPLHPSNISPPQPVYGDGIRDSFPFQPPLPPYNGQVLPNVENQLKFSGYGYSQNKISRTEETFPKDSDQAVNQPTQEAGNNTSNPSFVKSQNNLINHINPTAENPNLSQRLFPYPHQNYIPENQISNFAQHPQVLWPALQGSNQFSSNQGIPFSFPGYSQFFQPNPYHPNLKQAGNQQDVISSRR